MGRLDLGIYSERLDAVYSEWWSTPRPGVPIVQVIGRAHLGSVEVRSPNWWEHRAALRRD